MAVTQTGSSLEYPINSTANTGTVSSTITVPADAELVIVGVSGYQGTNDGHEKMTFTKGGADTQMVRARCGRSDQSTFWQAAVFWLLAPDTGANKTLKWDWISTGLSSDSDQLFSVTFWKGVDTAAPVRAMTGAQSNSFPITTPTLMSQSGDLVYVWFGGYTGNTEGSINSWTNATTLSNCTHAVDSDGALATNTATGNQTVSAATKTNFTEGGLCALALMPPNTGTGIQQVGPVRTYCPNSNANTGTVATDIYAPSTATLIVVGVSAFQGTANGLTSMTYTKSGADTAMTKVTGADAGTAQWQSTMFYLVNPDTGFGTLKWDWVGSGNSSSAGYMFSVTFWKGVDTASPVRSSSGVQGSGFPRTTASLTAQSGDKTIAWYGGYEASAEGSIDTWSNLTLLSQEQALITSGMPSDGAWATADPTGNGTVAASTATGFTEGGLTAAVFKPLAVNASASVTGNSATADVGTVTASGTTGSSGSGQDNQREVGDIGMVGMGRFMGN